MAGDASTVPAGVPPLAAVFTCFALQQMPKPKDALAAWTAALAPGGVLVACFWPTMMEVEGPWRRLIDICPPPRRNVSRNCLIKSKSFNSFTPIFYFIVCEVWEC